MTHISGFERSQILLLPEAVDDYVGADNPVRFIDAFVERMRKTSRATQKHRLFRPGLLRSATGEFRS